MQARKKNAGLFISRRANARFGYDEAFTVRFDDQIVRLKAFNLSNGGISGEIKGIGVLQERLSVEVYMHNYKPIRGKVRWARGREVGISFTEDLAKYPQIRALVSRIENGEPAVPEV